MRELTVSELSFVVGAGEYCGPEGSWLSSIIPDSPFGADFGPACRRHDADYQADSGISREAADARFLDGMLEAAGSNIFARAAAYVYYTAVRLGGGPHYQGGQSSGANQIGVLEAYYWEKENGQGLV